MEESGAWQCHRSREVPGFVVSEPCTLHFPPFLLTPIPAALLVLPKSSWLSSCPRRAGTRSQAAPPPSRSLSEPLSGSEDGIFQAGMRRCCRSAALPPESGRGLPSAPGPARAAGHPGTSLQSRHRPESSPGHAGTPRTPAPGQPSTSRYIPIPSGPLRDISGAAGITLVPFFSRGHLMLSFSCSSF